MTKTVSGFLGQNQDSLKSQTFKLFVGKFVSLFFQMLTPVVLTRLLSRENYGLYQQILLLCTFVGPILIWGMNTSLYFFFPTAEHKVNQLLSQTLLFLVVTGTLFFPILVFGKGFFAKILSNQSFYEFIIPCALYIFFYIQSDLIENLFVVEKKSNFVVTFLIVSSFLRAGFSIAAYLVFRSVAAQIWGLVIHLGLQTLFLWGYLLHHYRIRFDPFHWDKTYFRAQLRYASPVGWSGLIGNIGVKIDKFILSHFFSRTDFAVYSVAFFRVPFINILFPSIGNVIVPQIVRFGKDKNFSEARRLWHKMILVFALITIPFVFYSFFTAREMLVLLFSDKYLSSIGIYRLTLLTFFVQILARGTIITAFGETRYLFKVQLISTLTGSLLGYFLVKRFGIWGAAWTAVFIFYLSGWLQVYKSKKILNLDFAAWLPWKDLGKIFAISSLAVPVFFVFKWLALNRLLFLALTFLVYFLVIYRLYIHFGYTEFIDFVKNTLKTKTVARKIP
ncbi:MAG: polysaccharide biosynthesis protein [Desulfobacteraceae bacterium]|nr:MAG: polysaccharide biosynthesis protein [Desulfobacteraceae bacterium]